MNKSVSPKIVVLTFGILAVLFLAGFYIFAWQEPSQAPPGGNVPAPINVGPTHQTKEGDLTIGTADIKGDGSISTNLNSDLLDFYHAADLLAGAGGRTIYYTKCLWRLTSGWTIPGVRIGLTGSESCTPPSCASGHVSLATGCASSGELTEVSYSPQEPSRASRFYGWCERVCLIP